MGEKIRTPDLLVRSQTLYPAELNAHVLTTIAILQQLFTFVNAFFNIFLILQTEGAFPGKAPCDLPETVISEIHYSDFFNFLRLYTKIPINKTADKIISAAACFGIEPSPVFGESIFFACSKVTEIV